MNIVSYNCQNFKSNIACISDLIKSNDIIFLIEHWLAEEEAYLLNDLSTSHSIIFQSDFSFSSTIGKRRKGRPFGGKCWIISNRLRVKDYQVLSNAVSRIEVEGDCIESAIFYDVWMPFDDGSFERYSALQSNLSLIGADIEDRNDTNVLVIGDFNADLKRGKRFDIALSNFIFNNNLIDSFDIFPQKSSFTYSNGSYRSRIDHILVNLKATENLLCSAIYTPPSGVSDHNAVSCSITNSNTCISTSELNVP